MKWSVMAFDKQGERWVNESVIAEKCFIANSGVLSFLDTEKIEAVPAIPEVTAPAAPTLVPVRVGTSPRRPGRKVMKAKAKQIPVRVFAPGAWHDLEIIRV